MKEEVIIECVDFGNTDLVSVIPYDKNIKMGIGLPIEVCNRNEVYERYIVVGEIDEEGNIRSEEDNEEDYSDFLEEEDSD